MAPKPKPFQSEEEPKEIFQLKWILAIIFNVAFIIALFIALIYCINRRKQSKIPNQEGSKLSPIFRKKNLSQSNENANFHYSTPSSASSSKTNSSSQSSKKIKKNRVSSIVESSIVTKNLIESNHPITPVRYNSPPLQKPLSSVYTVQQQSMSSNIKNNDSQYENSINLKNYSLNKIDSKTEINNPFNKFKENKIEREENSEADNSKTINNDIDSLISEVINDENESINSLNLSEDDDLKNDSPDKRNELIERLSQKMLEEQTNYLMQKELLDKVSSEADVTISDSGFGGSHANLSNITQISNLKMNSFQKNQIANAEVPANQKESISSVKEFSFSQTTNPDRLNGSGVDKHLHELQNNSKVITRNNSKKSRNGSSKKRRMKSAGVQTTPSLRRHGVPDSVKQQNTESTFSSAYTDIVYKLDPVEQNENLTTMVPIEEENFFYDPESELYERKYFIYLISDTSNPYYKKDCIGKIMLPSKGHLTLSDLREQLFKQSEDSVKTILKKGKNFRFLTETYRFVAQNENIASVKEVYPTQGIFLKLNSSDNPIQVGKNKSRNDLSNFVNVALSESQVSFMKNPNTGNINSKSKSNNLTNTTSYAKNLSSLNKEATGSSNVPKVHLNRPEDEKNFLTPLQLSFNNSTSSLRTVSPDDRSTIIREALFKRHNRCLYPQPIVRRALPKHVVYRGEYSKKCFVDGCFLISMLKCAKCGRAYYCSNEHKRIHWNLHKHLCHRPPWRL